MKRTFKEVYPDGLKMPIVLFLKAFDQIMKSSEIDRIIASTCGKERQSLIALKNSYEKDFEWYDYHWITVSRSIQSPELFRDILTYMVLFDESENYTE